MAVTLTQESLTAAIRAGTSPAENAEIARLLAYATEAVQKHAPEAPSVVQNEAVIRLAAYLYDSPNAAPGSRQADALLNSQASAILKPWRVHRGRKII